MNSDDFKPGDWIAVIVVIGALILKLCGIDGTVDLILVAVVAFYFSDRAREYRSRPRISRC